MRLAILVLLPLMLAGCLTNEPAPPAAQSSQPTAAAPATDDKPAAGQRRGAPAATRGAAAPYVPPPQAQEGPTDLVLEARQTCWSEGNKNKGFKTLEARADWVNKCIADRLKTLGL